MGAEKNKQKKGFLGQVGDAKNQKIEQKPYRVARKQGSRKIVETRIGAQFWLHLGSILQLRGSFSRKKTIWKVHKKTGKKNPCTRMRDGAGSALRNNQKSRHPGLDPSPGPQALETRPGPDPGQLEMWLGIRIGTVHALR